MSEDEKETPLTDDQLNLIKDIIADGTVSIDEFDKFSASILADGKKTQQEIETLTDLFKKAISDAKNAEEKTMLANKYGANVPAGTFEAVMETLEKAEIKKSRYNTILMVSVIVGFLFSTLLSILTGG